MLLMKLVYNPWGACDWAVCSFHLVAVNQKVAITTVINHYYNFNPLLLQLINYHYNYN